MKTDYNIKDNTLRIICENGQEITNLAHNVLTPDNCVLQCSTLSAPCFESTTTYMGLKNQHYKQIASNSCFSEDTRSLSLPSECFQNANEKEAETIDAKECCDKRKLPQNNNNPPHSPSNETWFKTWPERCDKVRSNETNPSNSTVNECESENTQHDTLCNNEKRERVYISNGCVSLNEALQSISLAYSPITKQLHLVETPECSESRDEVDHVCSNKDLADTELPQVVNDQMKLGHRRIQAGSFSSTVSTFSESSTLGSLLDSDERWSLSNFDGSEGQKKKKTFSDFLNRNVFTWKPSDVQSSVGQVWKLFGKTAQSHPSKSPQHVIVSSSALIQHPRPSNLPAKSAEEEVKHREEYKAILLAAKKKEALQSANREKLEKKQLKQEERLANAAKHFTHAVLPNWEGMKDHKKTRELWWQGLPSNVRGKLWSLAIGNELNLTSQLYEICLARAQARLNNNARCPATTDDPEDRLPVDREQQSLDVIRLDISRTFPHLGIFQEGGPYSDTLHSLLAAYACYRPDVGYVQGMSYIAAILILNMDQSDAFVCFANLLNRPLHMSAFALDQKSMRAYYQAYDELFDHNLPKLFGHFRDAGLTPDLYLLDWIYTIFAKAVPLDVACRIWDVFLRDGYEFIFKTALGILYLHQDILFKMDFVDGSQFLTKLPDNISSDLLFKSIQTITITIGKQNFGQIVNKYKSANN